LIAKDNKTAHEIKRTLLEEFISYLMAHNPRKQLPAQMRGVFCRRATLNDLRHKVEDAGLSLLG
jgi:hypothetical protein